MGARPAHLPMAEQPTPADYAAAARRLIRRARAAMLSTALKSRGGWPYGSLVTVALDADLSPLMLFSTLSDHTRNLADDPKASLLIEEASRRRNPQTGPRATVLGRIEPTGDRRHRRRFLARHPDAALYADFADFGFFRMAIERIHFVGGFAQAIWLSADQVAADAEAAAAIAEAEPDILRHMNEDHSDAVDHYARTLLGRSGSGWRMTGVDPDGADLTLGGRFARLEFRAPVRDHTGVREELVRLAGEDR
ncbi:MAG: HugZ family protein [Rhodospirillales bacterium]